MKESTRRDVLKTGAATITASLAGCASLGDEGNGQNGNGSGNRNMDDIDEFDRVLEPDETIGEEQVIDGEFSIMYPQELYDASTEENKTILSQNFSLVPHQLGDISFEDVLSSTDGYAGIQTATYDIESEEELISGLENEGFRTYEGDIDSKGWKLFEGEGLEDIRGDADFIAAIKGKNGVFAPDYHSRDIGDTLLLPSVEEGIQTAIDTYEGETESHTESGTFRGDTAKAMRDFVRNEDLQELEGAQHMYGETTAEPIKGELNGQEHEIYGILELNRVDGDTTYAQRLPVNEDGDVIGPIDPEVYQG